MKKPVFDVVEKPPEEIADPVSSEFLLRNGNILILVTTDNQEDFGERVCDPKGFPRLRGWQPFSRSWVI